MYIAIEVYKTVKLLIICCLSNTQQNCTAESDTELSCAFPAILPELLDGLMNGTLQLTTSLVAASVPGLDNLHLMSQFVIEFADDPVITPLTQAIPFQPNTTIMISVSSQLAICSICHFIPQIMGLPKQIQLSHTLVSRIWFQRFVRMQLLVKVHRQ